MFSFKQLEAIYWIDHEGGFAAAARRLHATQAAISKRVQELEAVIGEELFDRSQRQARLTDKGRLVLHIAQSLLAQRDLALEGLLQPGALVRKLRIGVTELVAMTWLPQLLTRIRARYPQVTVEPEVDAGARLRDRLVRDELDLALVPDAFGTGPYAARPLQRVAFAWMCRPGLVPHGRALTAAELAAHTLLTQGGDSGLGVIVERWLDQHQAGQARPPVVTHSLLPLIGLTIAGAGLSYMPRDCLQPLVDAGSLQLVASIDGEPPVPYVALYKPRRKSIVVAEVSAMAQEACDFSALFSQGGDGAASAPWVARAAGATMRARRRRAPAA